jgi:hypothetical protein
MKKCKLVPEDIDPGGASAIRDSLLADYRSRIRRARDKVGVEITAEKRQTDIEDLIQRALARNFRLDQLELPPAEAAHFEKQGSINPSAASR